MATDALLAPQAGEPLIRSPLSAAVLSLLLPGLGHLYIGQPRRAVVLLGALLALHVAFILCWFGWLPRFSIIAGVMLLGVSLYAFAITNAVLAARRAGDYHKQRYNRWYVYAVLLAAAPVVSVALTAAIAAATTGPGTYAVPSASMDPTLRVGDTLLVDTRYYRTHAPARGEVAAYINPKQPGVTFIKRIVALGGDKIAVLSGHVVIEGRGVTEPYINVGDPAFSQNNMPEMIVPAGFVFVLGDNRANSADSRQADTHGPVPVGNLIGRATELAFSSEVSRSGKWVGTPAAP
jgi:signal peptidase I